MYQFRERSCVPAFSRMRKSVLLGISCAALCAGSASAAVIRSTNLVDFTGGSLSFGFDGANLVFGTNKDFTFSDNKGPFFNPSPVDVTTSGGGAVTALTLFGLQPTNFFDPVRGSGVLEFGAPGRTNVLAIFSPFATATTISTSFNGFYIGLADTLSDGVHYGYGQFDGTTLKSVAFESVAGRSIVTPVPLPSSAPMLGAGLIGLGGLGYAAKRKKASAAA